MTQHDYDLADATGAAFRADGNLLFQAIASMNSGATEPATKFANMGWFDTANNLMKVRNEGNTDWITIAEKTATEWKPYWNTALMDVAFAKLAGPAFTGNPTAPTQSFGDSSTKLATTAFVQNAQAVVAKTADETVNNSTTLQDDSHLVFALLANTTYLVNVILLLNAVGTVPDFKFKWTVPSGCTIFWDALDGSGWSPTSSVILDTESTQVSHTSASGTRGGLYRMIVKNGANAGNLQLQWAQNTANASDSKVLKHSHMIIHNLGAT